MSTPTHEDWADAMLKRDAAARGACWALNAENITRAKEYAAEFKHWVDEMERIHQAIEANEP